MGRNGRRSAACWEDRRQPLAPALEGRGAPDDLGAVPIPEEDLPHDAQGRLLRPGVVWFGEALSVAALDAAEAAVASCDLFMTVGTSSVVYPAAGFAYQAAGRGAAVAEFNTEPTDASDLCTFVFQGRAGETLPAALGVTDEVEQLMAGAG